MVPNLQRTVSKPSPSLKPRRLSPPRSPTLPTTVLTVVLVLATFGPKTVSALKCYVCNPCTNNAGVLTNCTGANNCYVATGRQGLYEGAVRGCYTTIPIPIPYLCQNFTSYTLDGSTYVDVNACICGMNGCNFDLPARAVPVLGSTKIGIFVLVSVATAVKFWI